jgi:2-polyprenyl-3-methyl-5-hydroxy-6-metoxy-1,4-benzoquinol methylase
LIFKEGTMATVASSKEQFLGKMLAEVGAAMSGALVLIGDKLGLYKALAAHGPLDSVELAQRTGTTERYIREWLAAQAASGYIHFDAATKKYSMDADQIAVLADEQSEFCMLGGFDCIASVYKDEPKVTEAFRTGRGVGWHEHSQCLFRGTERFFRSGYAAHLVQDWLPALEGVVEKLNRGAKVADVGCGHGASTILMAKAFPKSQFIGFDYHLASVHSAEQAARDAGVAANCRFEVAAAKDYPGNDFDLIACFDCLHDMGDPAGAAAHVLKSLKHDGTWLIVEPFANDTTGDNLNPIGRIFYSASTMVCVPASLSQEVGLALGAQAGEARLRAVVEQGGFTRFRRAAATPFNLILEARP